MSNLAGLPPLGQKQQKSKPRPDYLAAVRELPCCICYHFGFPQIGPSYAHHTICGRYSQRRTPDTQAIPLCYCHHQGAMGIHTSPKWWVSEFGPDTDFIAGTQDQLAHLLR